MIEVDTIWMKARMNVPVPTFPRDYSLCNYVIIDDGPPVLVVSDTQLVDAYNSCPVVVGPPFVRFYAGAPLYSGGRKIGTLCVIDMKPHHDFDAKKQQSLIDLANSASDLIEIITGSDKDLERESHHLKMTLMRHISAPLLAINEQYHQLHSLIQLYARLDNPNSSRSMEQLQQLLYRFSSTVEQLSSTLEIALRLGTNILPQVDVSSTSTTISTSRSMSRSLSRDSQITSSCMTLQSYTHRLEQLTSLVGCTGRSLHFTVDNYLHQDSVDSKLLSQWEIVPHNDLDLLATVISYLSLEFTIGSEAHHYHQGKHKEEHRAVHVHISCSSPQLIEGEKLHNGELLIELSFPPIIVNQHNASSQTNPTLTISINHFTFLEEILSLIHGSIQFPNFTDNTNNNNAAAYDRNIVKILVPCQLLLIINEKTRHYLMSFLSSCSEDVSEI